MKCLFLVLTICCVACSSGSPTSNRHDTDKLPESPDAITPDLAEIRRLYPERYKTDYRVNLATPDSIYHFLVRHYCLYDSAVIVPSRYNFDTNAPFTTHNFETEILITRGEDTLVRKKVIKDDFRGNLFPALDSFGVMLPPTCKVNHSKLILEYSISVPVTDVGIGLTLLVDTMGNYSIQR